MPLHLPDPPTGLPDRVKATLHSFVDGAHFSTKALRGARKDRLDLSTPHQVFTLGIDDITSGGGLDRAQPVGWRYLVEDGGQAIASAETTPGPDGAQEVSQFTEGPFVAETDKAVKAVRLLPQLAVAGFELRLLRIAPLYVMALWLHSPVTDLVVPLAPSPFRKEGKPLPAREFLAELTELAQRARRTGPPPTT